MLAVKIEMELLIQHLLDTVEGMPAATSPEAEKKVAALYRTIVSLRNEHGREAVFVLTE